MSKSEHSRELIRGAMPGHEPLPTAGPTLTVAMTETKVNAATQSNFHQSGESSCHSRRPKPGLHCRVWRLCSSRCGWRLSLGCRAGGWAPLPGLAAAAPAVAAAAAAVTLKRECRGLATSAAGQCDGVMYRMQVSSCLQGLRSPCCRATARHIAGKRCTACCRMHDPGQVMRADC